MRQPIDPTAFGGAQQARVQSPSTPATQGQTQPQTARGASSGRFSAPPGGLPTAAFAPVPPTAMPVPAADIAPPPTPMPPPMPQQMSPMQQSAPRAAKVPLQAPQAAAPPAAPTTFMDARAAMPGAPGAPPPNPAGGSNYGNYGNMFGWDTDKLNSADANSIKYQFGRWLQDSGYKPQDWRGNMQGLADLFNKAYGTNVKAGGGSDTLDFGQGWGHLTDVIFGAGAGTEDDDVWGWIDTPYPGSEGAAGGGAPGLPPPGAPGAGAGAGAGVGEKVWYGGGPGFDEITGKYADPNDPRNSMTDRSGVAPGPALPGGLTPDGDPAPFDNAVDVEVGDDPLSELITSALGGIMQTGGTPYGQDVAATLQDLIGSGGTSPGLLNKLIGAREDAGTLFEGLLNDARGGLADMGQLSTPGVEQGGTNYALDKITGTVGKELGRTVRDIESDALDLSNENLMSAISLATGMSQDMAQNILGAAGSGTQRQQVLANIALQTLSQNQEWAKFLAEFGLEQAQVAESIANGRIEMLIPLLQLFMRGAEQSAGGYVD